MLVLAVPALENKLLPFFEGKYEDWEGSKKEKKMHKTSVHFFGGHYYYKTGEMMRFLAKMLAADHSNAKDTYPPPPKKTLTQ